MLVYAMQSAASSEIIKLLDAGQKSDVTNRHVHFGSNLTTPAFYF